MAEWLESATKSHAMYNSLKAAGRQDMAVTSSRQPRHVPTQELISAQFFSHTTLAPDFSCEVHN